MCGTVCLCGVEVEADFEMNEKRRLCVCVEVEVGESGRRRNTWRDWEQRKLGRLCAFLFSFCLLAF